MKTKQIGSVLLALVALCGDAMAELTLVEAKREVRDTEFGQAYVGKDAVYWIQSSPSANNASVAIRSFTTKGTSEHKKVTLPAVPMIMSPLYRSLQTKGLLLAYMDYAGKFHVSQIDDSLATVKKTVNLDSPSIVNEIILTQENYVIGGIGGNDFASLPPNTSMGSDVSVCVSSTS